MTYDLMLIDGLSVLNRAYYGVKSNVRLTDETGRPTGALMGFLNIVHRYLKAFSPNQLCVAFDHSSKTFRHEAYAAYKGTRKPAPDDLKSQIDSIQEILTKMGIAHLCLPGYEADDLIGTLAKKHQAAGHRVVILSGDRDLMQLIDDQIHLMYLTTSKSVDPFTPFTLASFQATYGLTPEQYIDFKVLKGDTSDNIPGVSGFGDKRATQLLQTYGSLDQIITNRDKLNPKQRENLENALPFLPMAKTLCRIKTDVPLAENGPFDIPDWSNTEAHNILKSYGLNQIIQTWQIMPSETTEQAIDVQPSQSALLIEQVELNQTTLKALADKKWTKEPIFIHWRDAEATVILDTLEPVRFYLYQDPQVEEIELHHVGELQQLLKLLQKTGQVLVGWRLKTLFRTIGEAYLGAVFDLRCAAYALEENFDAQWTLHELLKQYAPQLSIETVAQRLQVMRQVYETAQQKIKARNLDQLIYQMDMPLIQVLGQMEAAGFQIDQHVLDDIAKNFKTEIDQIKDEIYALAGRSFNIASTQQLGTILFEDLKLPVIKKTKTKKYATSQDVLQKLKGLHPIIDHILRYRMLTKLVSTYIDGLDK